MKTPLTHLRLRTLPWLLGLLGLLAGSAGAWGQTGAVLSACANHSPPFMLFAHGEPVGGFSLELLQALAKQMGRRLQVSDLPWSRCLQYVKSGKLHLAIDAYDDAERRKTYLYSTAYHTLTPQVFYKAGSLLDALQIRDRKSLDRFRGCGVQDYTYAHYDLQASTLDLGAADDAKMLQKLKAGHCDYAVEELEFIVGGRSYTADWPDESDLKSIRPAWARGPQLHFVMGTGPAQGQALRTELDLAIAWAEKSGLTGALRKKYLGIGDKPTKKP
jgi:ABC-type amino acid transport substrate-binding protein